LYNFPNPFDNETRHARVVTVPLFYLSYRGANSAFLGAADCGSLNPSLAGVKTTIDG
jgi:hypothetical protein